MPAEATPRVYLPTSLRIPHPHLDSLDSRALHVQRCLKAHDHRLFLTIDGPPDPRTRHLPLHQKHIIPKRYTVWRREDDGRVIRVGNFPLDDLDAIYRNVLALDRAAPGHEDSAEAVERANDKLRQEAADTWATATAESFVRSWRNSGVVLHTYRHFFPDRSAP